MSKQASPLVEPFHTDITVVADSPWRENAFFSFWDSDSEVYGTVHMSTSPNASRRRARFGIQAQLAPHTSFKYDLVESLDFNSFTSECIHFGMDGHVTVNTEAVSIDVKMESKFAYLDYSSQGVIPELIPGFPLQHFQQACTFQGKATIDSQVIDVAGTGFRDRTWGYRNEDANFGEYIGMMACFENFSFTFIKFLDRDGNSRTQGAILDNNQHDLSDVKLVRNGAGGFHSITLTLANGEQFNIRRRRANVAESWLWMSENENPGESFCACEEIIELETSSGENGYGRLEQGIKRQAS